MPTHKQEEAREPSVFITLSRSAHLQTRLIPSDRVLSGAHTKTWKKKSKTKTSAYFKLHVSCSPLLPHHVPKKTHHDPKRKPLRANRLENSLWTPLTWDRSERKRSPGVRGSRWFLFIFILKNWNSVLVYLHSINTFSEPWTPGFLFFIVICWKYSWLSNELVCLKK